MSFVRDYVNKAPILNIRNIEMFFFLKETRPWHQGRLGYVVGTAPDTQDLVLKVDY
jgi:methylthioribose-1-phosphate isomerase